MIQGIQHSFLDDRLIYLLPQFSKILEKLFVQRLYYFIEKHNLLSEHQYGFRSNRSTTMAVMDLIEQISTATDNKEYMAGFYYTIDHRLLMSKLEKD